MIVTKSNVPYFAIKFLGMQQQQDLLLQRNVSKKSGAVHALAFDI
jgi:hypothetical protein